MVNGGTVRKVQTSLQQIPGLIGLGGTVKAAIKPSFGPLYVDALHGQTVAVNLLALLDHCRQVLVNVAVVGVG